MVVVGLVGNRQPMDRLAASARHQHVHNGAVVYEWDQSLTEVNVYARVPEGVRAKQIYCDIRADGLAFGIGANKPYLDVRVRTATGDGRRRGRARVSVPRSPPARILAGAPAD